MLINQVKTGRWAVDRQHEGKKALQETDLDNLR